MSSPADPTPVNGRISPLAARDNDVDRNGHRSDSDLSDVQDAVVAVPSPPSSPDPNDISNHQPDGLDSPESEHATDGNGSEDADYDLEESIPSAPSDAGEDTRPSSRNSERPPKRKAAAEEDEFIKANPELYGLRRSVRWQPSLSPRFLLIDLLSPDRPNPENSLVSSFASTNYLTMTDLDLS
jgi:chromodomain-helicase-DNA-binding protein 1